MRISAAGIRLIQEFEGCLKKGPDGKFRPYICPAGVLTIGWGHTNAHGRSFGKDTVWTQQDCDDALREDLRGFERAVDRLVKVALTQGQYDALVSFAYNCGEGNLAKSTLLKKVNRGDFEGAAREFAKWNRGGGKVLKGLTRRRAAEALLFQSAGVIAPQDAAEPPEPMPQQVDPPAPPKTIATSREAIGTGVGGVAGTAVVVNEAVDAAQKATDAASGLLAAGPWILLAVVVVAFAGFLIWKRHQRLKEEQV